MSFTYSAVRTQDCPCNGCGKRQAACGVSCKEYHEWKAEHSEKVKAVQKKKNNDRLAVDYACQQTEKIKAKYKGEHYK